MTEAELRAAKELLARVYGAREWHLMEDKNGVMVYADVRGVSLGKAKVPVKTLPVNRYWIFGVIGLFVVYISLDKIKFLSPFVMLNLRSIKRVLKLVILAIFLRKLHKRI